MQCLAGVSFEGGNSRSYGDGTPLIVAGRGKRSAMEELLMLVYYRRDQRPGSSQSQTWRPSDIIIHKKQHDFNSAEVELQKAEEGELVLSMMVMLMIVFLFTLRGWDNIRGQGILSLTKSYVIEGIYLLRL